jgi:SecD/SecF fusion protein
MMSHRVLNCAVVSLALAAISCASFAYGEEPVTHVLKYEIDTAGLVVGEAANIDDLVKSMNRRLKGIGRAKALTDKQFEIALDASVSESDVQLIKRILCAIGTLEFRVTANPNRNGDKPIVDEASGLPSEKHEVYLDGKVVAEWMTYWQEEFGPIEQQDERVVKRLSGNVPEALVLLDSLNVGGEYLTAAEKKQDDFGKPTIVLSFNPEGAKRLGRLTIANMSDSKSNAPLCLGIILDKCLLTAPRIVTPVHDKAQISGGHMSEREVDFILTIMNEGTLPYTIREVVDMAADK